MKQTDYSNDLAGRDPDAPAVVGSAIALLESAICGHSAGVPTADIDRIGWIRPLPDQVGPSRMPKTGQRIRLFEADLIARDPKQSLVPKVGSSGNHRFAHRRSPRQTAGCRPRGLCGDATRPWRRPIQVPSALHGIRHPAGTGLLEDVGDAVDDDATIDAVGDSQRVGIGAEAIGCRRARVVSTQLGMF